MISQGIALESIKHITKVQRVTLPVKSCYYDSQIKVTLTLIFSTNVPENTLSIGSSFNFFSCTFAQFSVKIVDLRQKSKRKFVHRNLNEAPHSESSMRELQIEHIEQFLCYFHCVEDIIGGFFPVGSDNKDLK